MRRDLTEDGLRVDLSGVENRVRETTIYGEVGAELPSIEATVGARYTVSKLSGSGQHLSPLAWASSMPKIPSGPSIGSCRRRRCLPVRWKD